MLRDESSEQSILAVMTRFVQAVNAMDDTVMIPMRLKDLPDEQAKTDKVSIQFIILFCDTPLL